MSDADWVQDRKVTLYEALQEEVTALEQDWEQMYETSVWEEQTEFTQRIVEVADPAIHEQVEHYLEARDQCLDVLEEASMYADALAEQFGEHEGFETGPYSRRTRFKYDFDTGYKPREYSVKLDEVIGEYGDELSSVESASEMRDLVEENRLRALKQLRETGDNWHERLWEAMTDEADQDIAAFASRFNMFYADLLDEATRLDAMIEQQLEDDLRAAVEDDGWPDGYAS